MKDFEAALEINDKEPRAYLGRGAAYLKMNRGKDAVADSARVNAAIEAMVREAPTQYLWIHRRFKRQPDGVSLYSKG